MATLKILIASPLLIAFLNGMESAISSISVRSTTMCTTALLPFLNIGDASKNINPQAGAIKAVGDDCVAK